jgi:ribulose-phosphate 3-epimerase
MRSLLHGRGCEDRVKIANDGGNRAHTVPLIRAAGADTIVPGSLVFGSSNLAETFAWLHSL